jgi:hypothetical protein
LFLFEVQVRDLRVQTADDRRVQVRARVRLRRTVRMQRMRLPQHEVIST